MFEIKNDDVRRLVLVNYLLILIETPIGIYLPFKFPDFKLSIPIIIIAVILLATFILHLTLMLKFSKIIRDIALLFLAFTVVISLTVIMHYVPTIRSAMILMYIPSVIFAASQCLSFGMSVSIIMVVCFSLLTLGEYYNFHPIFKSAIDMKSLGPNWQVSNLFSFFFLLILSFMSNYYFGLLRKRENKIQHLADLNKMLYQKSKTTSDEIFKKMSEAMVVVDKGFDIVQYNDTFKSLADANEEFTGKNLFNISLGFSDELKARLNEAKQDLANHMQLTVSDKSKASYSIHISQILLSEDESGYIIIINKQALPWGTVFDSESKKPVDLVLVRLMSGSTKKVIETKVTDREGRFGFIVPAGKYYIFVSREGYKFPSQKSIPGYRGDQIDVKSDTEGIIKIDVPIDKVSQNNINQFNLVK